jgi:single-strand DNA-binding protein
MTTNGVTITGNLVRDPDLRYVPSGQACATFSVAVNRRWQNPTTSQWTEATSYFDCVAWGSLGEHIAESLHRGERVIVTGRMDQRSFETSEGEKRSKIEVTADEVGPSLRWATVDVHKAERREPVAAGATAGPADSSYADDSEPF